MGLPIVCCNRPAVHNACLKLYSLAMLPLPFLDRQPAINSITSDCFIATHLTHHRSNSNKRNDRHITISHELRDPIA